MLPERSAALIWPRTPHGYHDTALIRRELEDGRFLPCDDRNDEPNKAAHPRRAFRPLRIVRELRLRNEIEDRDAGKLEAATDYAESVIADRHGRGEVAAKIQAHVIVAVA